MADLRIERLVAREILDSRGRPTVEADVVLADGVIGRASVPSGASTGTHEAVELRGRGSCPISGSRGAAPPSRTSRTSYGLPVRGIAADEQDALDRRMIELDGTPTKARLGALDQRSFEMFLADRVHARNHLIPI